MIEILVTDNQDLLNYDDQYKEIFKKLTEITAESEGVSNDLQVSLLLVDNNKIKEYNKKFRNKDYATDVLSFPQYNSKEEIIGENVMVYLGDVVISCEKAIEQANEYGHSVKREISYLYIHSLLHLLGYTHDQEENKKEMRKKEEDILEKLDIVR